MANINSATFIGNLTRDPAPWTSKSGKSCADFDIAVNGRRDGDGKETVDYVCVKVFDKTADACVQYLKQGNGVYINGPVSTEAWIDKKTSEPRSKLVVLANRVEFLGSSPKSEGESTPASTEPRAVNPAGAKAAGKGKFTPAGAGTGDSIPF